MRYIILLLLLTGCGEIDEFYDDFNATVEGAVDVVDPTDSVEHAATTTTTTVKPTPKNPTCKGTYSTQDGLGGFLWKPESESTGKLAVLFPGNFQLTFRTCTVYDGYVADKLTFSKFANYDGQHGNLDRQNWRGGKAGHQYNAPALVICNDGYQDCAWEIKTPWTRVD